MSPAALHFPALELRMRSSYIAWAQALLFPPEAPDDRPQYDRLAIPHTFKPQLSFPEAVVATIGAFLRIILGSLLFAVWGTYSAFSWTTIRNPFLRIAVELGMGLIMLILVGILPLTFAVDLRISSAAISDLAATTQTISFQMDRHSPGIAMAGRHVANDELSAYLKTKGRLSERTFAAIATKCREINDSLEGHTSLTELTAEQRRTLRSDLYLTSESLGKAIKQKIIADPVELNSVAKLKTNMDKVTKFIPPWVKFAVAMALGLGTMIGWKRIVVTVGEKIGKEHLTYAQGASAELVAMGTIMAADHLGLPVSTTHVLSSGVAGTMAANGSGLQMETVRNLLLAWVLTLPVCVLLGAGIFAFGFNVLLRMGIH